MAEVPPSEPFQDGEVAKKKIVLEEKSKEDLVKIVRKQLILLKKAKDKSDELNERCLVLEEEKKNAGDKQSTDLVQFQQQIEKLETDILNLTKEKIKVNREKEGEIKELEEKLKFLEKEKYTWSTSLNEKDERLQCTLMQLDTMKETCRYFQEELSKLQNENLELKNEINVVTEEKNVALNTLMSQNTLKDPKNESHEEVVDEMKDLTQKYSICLEENCILESKLENLETEMKNIQIQNSELLIKIDNMKLTEDKDKVFLVNDNQNLQSELNELKGEYNALKEKVTASEKQIDSSNETLLDPQSELVSKNQRESFELQTCNVENKNKLQTVNEYLEAQNCSLTERLRQAEAEIKKQYIQLESSEEQNLKLNKEIEKLTSYLQDFSEFRAGYEHALLAGAPTDSLISTSKLMQEKGNVNSKMLDSAVDNVNKLPEVTNSSIEMCYPFEMDNTESISGVEFALLGGGDVNELFTDEKMPTYAGLYPFEPNSPSTFIDKEPMYQSTFESKSIDRNTDLMVMYKQIEMEKESLSAEITTMRTRFDDYSSLLQETLEDNKSLKLKLENYGKEKQDNTSELISTGTNTDSEVIYQGIHGEGQPEGNGHSFALEKENTELNEKLNNKCSELEEFNFQLELLIISIKQGVRSKTSAAPNKAVKELRENISILKTLVDDLIIRCNTSTIKIKAIESDLEELHLEKQALEEDMFQVKELNQFLECEVEQLKHSQNTPESYYSEHHIKSPELYSIEEIDEKCISNDADQEPLSEEILEKSGFEETDSKPVHLSQSDEKTGEIKTNDVSVQVSIPSQDFFSSDDDLLHDNKSKEEIKDYQTVIERLNAENSDLKSSLNDKSVLVERIHCEMDSLLEKVEAANYELQVKENDLQNAQCQVTVIQKKINELNCVGNSKEITIKYMKENLNELKTEKDELKSNVLSLNEFVSEALLDASKIIADQCGDLASSLSNKILHLKKVSVHMSIHYEQITSNLKIWQSTIENIINLENNIEKISTLNDEVNSLKKSILDLSSISIFEDKCSNECCTAISVLEEFHVLAQQFLLVVCSYLSNDTYHCNIRELDNYKTNIVPNLEKNIIILENKLSENKIEKEKGEPTSSFLEQQLEKGPEESLDVNIKCQLADTEVKMNKFKQIAMKLKKELMESKKQNKEISSERDKYSCQLSDIKLEFEKVSTEQFKCVQNYQSLQAEYDKLQDEIEILKENKTRLEADFSTCLLELNSYKEKLLTVESDLSKANQSLDASMLSKQKKEKLCLDLEGKIIILESKIKEKEQKILELETTVLQKLESINALTAENVKIKDHLDNSLKEEKKNNLLDLEMADYERSINELNIIVSKREEDINELKLKLDSEVKKNESILQEISYTETLKETEEKRAQSLKEILDKTKLELSIIKENAAEMQAKVSNLQTQLEFANQQEENYKLQLVKMQTEIQHLKNTVKTSSENNQRIVHSLESKISTQKEEIILANKEVEDIKSEFDNYKVRVHSVLKQQKSSVPTLALMDEDVKGKLESMINKFKMQVKDLSEKLKAVTMEYETLQEEYEALLKRHQKAIQNREKKDSEWHSKLEQLNLENNRLRASQEELSSQHLLQNEMLVSTYKKQIKIMNDEHKRTVSELQKQLESTEACLQRDQQKALGLPTTPTMQDSTMSSFDIFTQERQEGEGSESTDVVDTSLYPLSFSTIPTTEFQSFEKLLQSPVDSGTPPNYINYQDCEKLVADLNASTKKIEHLNDILNDSESTNLRLSEQVRVLKEEVRRLERNKEREQHAENLEYLKNVFIKFATLSACSEKAMLIPVLTTMLKLSPSEQQQLKSVAGDVDPEDATSSGWGSYLHRWSGLA